MEQRNRISISFKREYHHVYEHLQSIINKSDYISKAVEQYMQTEHSPVNHEEIRKIVMEILQSQGNLFPALNHPSSPADAMICDEDVALIADLF